MLDVAAASDSPGPAPFACAYLNGRADNVPPLLLALNGLDDIASLLRAAAGALRRGGVDAEPTVAFTPEGGVISKAARVSELRPNCCLILGCGEPFDSASVPERARHMHAAVQRESQRLGPLVRAEQAQMCGELPLPETGMPRAPAWRFSPSGRWKSGGLALSPSFRA
jgi:hypothetical protein